MAGEGHTVIGVEYIEQPIKEFFSEQDLEYTVVSMPDNKGKIYKVYKKQLFVFILKTLF